jgi:hypothetical protein
MKNIWVLTLLGCVAGFANTAISAETVGPQSRVQVAQACEQVISCGTKNGVRKEYPTPCAARDDGATNITPKTGATCEAATK